MQGTAAGRANRPHSAARARVRRPAVPDRGNHRHGRRAGAFAAGFVRDFGVTWAMAAEARRFCVLRGGEPQLDGHRAIKIERDMLNLDSSREGCDLHTVESWLGREL